MTPYTLMQSHFSAKSIKLFKGFSAQSASYPINLKDIIDQIRLIKYQYKSAE